ncbi:putative 40S ribosomal protein S1-B [Blattamonas nauphoetae]|uniref:Small ribosomal subunit protein eS1 n=1 Tax=Blattamonas nauphoetae TaxID=2049346 RepID=A0ABQ9XPQ4_9EUKA|nr:putative 40S ribosomal protein S1-B [Blattamonas nauphoetae]
MAIGKNKKLSKGSKKGGKKKVLDPFARKEWYDVKVPNCFSERVLGKTFVNKSQGIKLAKDALKGRVFETFLADINKVDEGDTFRKVRLRVEDVQGSSCLTNFHGMSITTDKSRSMVKKWQTLIEAECQIKTTDNYVLRFFCIGFTRHLQSSHKKTAYAQSQKIRAIRKKMIDVIRLQTSNSDLKMVVKKITTDTIGKQIERECRGIFPMQNCVIRKVKVVKAPKMEVAKLQEFYHETGEVTGVPQQAPVEETPVEASA